MAGKRKFLYIVSLSRRGPALVQENEWCQVVEKWRTRLWGMKGTVGHLLWVRGPEGGDEKGKATQRHPARCLLEREPGEEALL